MPTTIATFSLAWNRIDIVKRSGKNSLWVYIEGRKAATINTKGHFLLPLHGWRISDHFRFWILRRTFAVLALRRLDPERSSAL
ncbi:hypothetical protein [Salininema proteolyticum]|uniref:Uncharacterized protein n=1 Tax=Salininema proteolyticum TaxID=1607685 RepID=A0ABV8U511_9ACTN